MASKFVDVRAEGGASFPPQEIVISFYGPRGGSRATEVIVPDEARKLRDQIDTVLKELEQENKQC